MITHWLNEIQDRLRKYERNLQSSCSDVAIAALQQKVKSEFDATLPEGYREFLRRTDGLSYNGVVFYASRKAPYIGEEGEETEAFVEENFDFRELLADIGEYEHLLVLGHSDLDHYVFDLRTSDYVVKAAGSSDIVARYTTFDELFEYAAREALGYPRSQSTA